MTQSVSIVVRRGEYSDQYYEYYAVPESDADAACELIEQAGDEVVMVARGKTWGWSREWIQATRTYGNAERIDIQRDTDLWTFAEQTMSVFNSRPERMRERPMTEQCAELLERLLRERIERGEDAEGARVRLERLAKWPRLAAP